MRVSPILCLLPSFLYFRVYKLPLLRFLYWKAYNPDILIFDDTAMAHPSYGCNVMYYISASLRNNLIILKPLSRYMMKIFQDCRDSDVLTSSRLFIGIWIAAASTKSLRVFRCEISIASGNPHFNSKSKTIDKVNTNT